MKRLTSKNPLTEKEALNLSLTDLYMRLKAYEDTGLEPEEVRPVWISVKERLPETCTLVLACFDDVQVIAFYGNYQWHEAFSNQVFYPTYWMPLPEFPKEAPE